MAVKNQKSKVGNREINLTAVVIAKNEEGKIADCLKSLLWVDELLVIDNGSIDKTAEIARTFKAKVIYSPNGSYKESRQKGMQEARGDWVFYVDADERVTPKLKDEIVSLISNSKFQTSNVSAYAIPRRNIILGKELKHGGWWPDYVIHFLKKAAFKGWRGKLHEEPVFTGDLGYFINPLIHIKHDNLTDMVDKTNVWSLVEAKLMFDANHPPMNIIRFLSAVTREFWLRMIKNQAYLDGTQGIIYALYQVYSKFISYAKLWELQIERDDLGTRSSKSI